MASLTEKVPRRGLFRDGNHLGRDHWKIHGCQLQKVCVEPPFGLLSAADTCLKINKHFLVVVPAVGKYPVQSGWLAVRIGPSRHILDQLACCFRRVLLRVKDLAVQQRLRSLEGMDNICGSVAAPYNQWPSKTLALREQHINTAIRRLGSAGPGQTLHFSAGRRRALLLQATKQVIQVSANQSMVNARSATYWRR